MSFLDRIAISNSDRGSDMELQEDAIVGGVIRWLAGERNRIRTGHPWRDIRPELHQRTSAAGEEAHRLGLDGDYVVDAIRMIQVQT